MCTKSEAEGRSAQVWSCGVGVFFFSKVVCICTLNKFSYIGFAVADALGFLIGLHSLQMKSSSSQTSLGRSPTQLR